MIEKIKENCTFNLDGCWIWQGRTYHQGTPLMTVGRSTRSVPRLSFTEFYGDVPDGFAAVSNCGHKLCVNPEHIVLVSAANYSSRTQVKDVCKYGHSLADAIRKKDGSISMCRTCERLRSRRRKNGNA